MDKVSYLQFEVCASLSDRDYLRKVETEPTKLLVLDSEHKLWLWEPTRRGSFPNLLPGFAKLDGRAVSYTCTLRYVLLLLFVFAVTQFSLGKSLTVVTSKCVQIVKCTTTISCYRK